MMQKEHVTKLNTHSSHFKKEEEETRRRRRKRRSGEEEAAAVLRKVGVMRNLLNLISVSTNNPS